MAHPAGKLLTGFFAVAAILVVATLVWTRNQAPPASPPLPSPNGYDDLIQASRTLSDKTSDFSTMDETDLRLLVEKNADALKLARTGLSRACQVPLDYVHPNPSYYTNLAKCKGLAQAFAAEGRLRELENRPADAADSYLSAIRLGNATRQGGLIIDALVGIAIESIGTVRLERLCSSLDAKQCRQAVAVLESYDAQQEPSAIVLARDKVWARRVYGGLRYYVGRLTAFKSLRQMEGGIVSRVNAQQTREQVLLLQLASRAYELEKGERPKTVADLVPAYLKAIPRDPTTGTNISYH
jgi:hypothetical protein